MNWLWVVSVRRARTSLERCRAEPFAPVSIEIRSLLGGSSHCVNSMRGRLMCGFIRALRNERGTKRVSCRRSGGPRRSLKQVKCYSERNPSMELPSVAAVAER